MGMVLRFPIERARSPAEIFADEPARILILPTVRIEREKEYVDLVGPELSTQSCAEPPLNGRRRRRTPRN
jgi:hypothetical protein